MIVITSLIWFRLRYIFIVHPLLKRGGGCETRFTDFQTRDIQRHIFMVLIFFSLLVVLYSGMMPVNIVLLSPRNRAAVNSGLISLPFFPIHYLSRTNRVLLSLCGCSRGYVQTPWVIIYNTTMHTRTYIPTSIIYVRTVCGNVPCTTLFIFTGESRVFKDVRERMDNGKTMIPQHEHCTNNKSCNVS